MSNVRAVINFLDEYPELAKYEDQLNWRTKEFLVELRSGKSLVEIGRKFNLNGPTVSQIVSEVPYRLYLLKKQESDIENNPDDIGTLDLSFRSTNALRKAGINSLSELLTKTTRDLLRIKNLGRNSLNDIHAALAEKGFVLSDF